MSEPFDAPETSLPTARLKTAGTSTSAATPRATTMSAFLPIAIIGLVLLAWFAFQATQLRAERDAIRDATTNQEKQIDEAKKLRDAFYAIAHGAEQLADAGNPGARVIVDGLKKRGITIAPDPSTGVPEPTRSK